MYFHYTFRLLMILHKHSVLLEPSGHAHTPGAIHVRGESQSWQIAAV